MKSIAIVLRPYVGTKKIVKYANLISPRTIVDMNAPPGDYNATFATYGGVLKFGKPTGKRLSANQTVPAVSYSRGNSVTHITLGPKFRGAIVTGEGDGWFHGGPLFSTKCLTSSRVVVNALDPSARFVVGIYAPETSLRSDDPNLVIKRDRSGGNNMFTVKRLTLPNAFTSDELALKVTPKGEPSRKSFVRYGVNGDICGVVTEFSIPTASSAPAAIASGPDKNLWFTEGSGNRIGRITTAGAITEFSTGVTANGGPRGIAAGPDGALWFTEYNAAQIGRVSTTGAITEYSAGLTPGSSPSDITTGPDGALWFTEYTGNAIGRITTSGTIGEFPIPTASSGPVGITSVFDGVWFAETVGELGSMTTSGTFTGFATGLPSGSQPFAIVSNYGSMWFTDEAANAIGKIDSSNTITETPIPTASSAPQGIAVASDGTIWFTEAAGNKIGKLDTYGVISEYPIRTSAGEPTGIVYGPDHCLWFTERAGNKIGRLQ